MTNPYCKGCPDRYLACHDSCEKFAEWRKEHAAERINRNDFNKEGWMGGKRR